MSFVVLCKRDPQKILKKCFLGVENIPLGFCPPSLGLSLGRYFDEFRVGDEPVKNGAERCGENLKEKFYGFVRVLLQRSGLGHRHTPTHTHTRTQIFIIVIIEK